MGNLSSAIFLRDFFDRLLRLKLPQEGVRQTIAIKILLEIKASAE